MDDLFDQEAIGVEGLLVVKHSSESPSSFERRLRCLRENLPITRLCPFRVGRYACVATSHNSSEYMRPA
jgi:hypothetical protein